MIPRAMQETSRRQRYLGKRGGNVDIWNSGKIRKIADKLGMNGAKNKVNKLTVSHDAGAWLSDSVLECDSTIAGFRMPRE